MGSILLEGGAEFQGRMAEPDRQAIALAGKKDLSVCIIPAAAAPDNNHERAGSKGVSWFQSLGVKNVFSLPVIDTRSAGDPNLAEILKNSDLIYLLGGFPEYLAKTLRFSRCWSAILDAYYRGAVLAGSSAGAMVMCGWYLNPADGQIHSGLGLLSGMIIIPHHETMGISWVEIIYEQMPDAVIVGIDEQTGMIRKKGSWQWNVYGKGTITVYRDHRRQIYSAEDSGFDIS